MLATDHSKNLSTQSPRILRLWESEREINRLTPMFSDMKFDKGFVTNTKCYVKFVLQRNLPVLLVYSAILYAHYKNEKKLKESITIWYLIIRAVHLWLECNGNYRIFKLWLLLLKRIWNVVWSNPTRSQHNFSKNMWLVSKYHVIVADFDSHKVRSTRLCSILLSDSIIWTLGNNQVRTCLPEDRDENGAIITVMQFKCFVEYNSIELLLKIKFNKDVWAKTILLYRWNSCQSNATISCDRSIDWLMSPDQDVLDLRRCWFTFTLQNRISGNLSEMPFPLIRGKS